LESTNKPLGRTEVSDTPQGSCNLERPMGVDPVTCRLRIGALLFHTERHQPVEGLEAQDVTCHEINSGTAEMRQRNSEDNMLGILARLVTHGRYNVCCEGTSPRRAQNTCKRKDYSTKCMKPRRKRLISISSRKGKRDANSSGDLYGRTRKKSETKIDF
jgi:hypothetical protein